MKKLVLVTGGAGYIGSVLVRKLLDAGRKVRVIDNLSFGGNSLLEVILHPDLELMKGDIREKETLQKAVRGVDAVVHLAAIVGDKACNLFEEEAREVNWTASVLLFRMAEQAGVKRFLFASTCSNYGVMDSENDLLNEGAPLQPQSHYSRLKVDFEQFLLEQKDSEVACSLLRFATVYGFSPRLRFDLTINHFTRDLTLGRELLIFAKDLWRPYCHVEDLCNSLLLVLKNPERKMRGAVFNVGDSKENYTKETIAGEVLKLVPEGKVTYNDQPGSDLRNYRVDFSRIQKELGFSITKTVPDGIREIHFLLKAGLPDNPFSTQYQNC